MRMALQEAVGHKSLMWILHSAPSWQFTNQEMGTCDVISASGLVILDGRWKWKTILEAPCGASYLHLPLPDDVTCYLPHTFTQILKLALVPMAVAVRYCSCHQSTPERHPHMPQNIYKVFLYRYTCYRSQRVNSSISVTPSSILGGFL